MRLDASYARLAEAFAERFAARRPAHTVGREAEFPLVDSRGRAGDSGKLWPELLETTGGQPVYDSGSDGSRVLIGVEAKRWFCLAEVGLCTVEIGVGPRRSLVELEADLAEALAFVGTAAARTGQRLLGYGIQPLTPPSARILTPKRRYLVLVQEIPRWSRWTVTASDQVHVRLGRAELVPAMNALNAASGAIIALCANSPVYCGRRGSSSGREALSAGVSGEPFRNGAVPRPFADIEDYVRWTAGFRYLFRLDENGRIVRPRVTFDRWMRRRQVSLEDYLLHEHYLWPSARPRARLGTLEIRPACQQPEASFAAAALALGLTERAPDLLACIADALGNSHWGRLLSYRRRAVRDGILAPEPTQGFLRTIVELADAGLRARGFGEHAYLDQIRERLAARRGPADEAEGSYAAGGGAGLAHALALHYESRP